MKCWWLGCDTLPDYDAAELGIFRIHPCSRCGSQSFTPHLGIRPRIRLALDVRYHYREWKFRRDNPDCPF